MTARIRSRRPELAHGLDGLGTWFGHKNDGAAFKPERTPKLACKIFCVLIREEILPVYKKQKSGRTRPDLSGVIKLPPVSRRTRGLTALNGIMERAVQDGCGDLLLKLRGNIADGFQ
jgi:hypothetical protein